MYPIFCTPRKFAEISGIDVKKVREYCRCKIIPNEKRRKSYLINTAAALDVMKQRTIEFAGHYRTREVKLAPVSPIKKRKKPQNDFLARCDALARESAKEEAARREAAEKAAEQEKEPAREQA